MEVWSRAYYRACSGAREQRAAVEMEIQCKIWIRLVVFTASVIITTGQITVAFGGDTYGYGEVIALECFVSGNAPYNVTWMPPDGSTSVQRGNMSVNADNYPTLTFEARREDTGSFTCRVNGGTTGTNNPTTVTVVPAILMGPEDMILEYNDVLTATFTCTAFGGNDTPLEIDWLAEAEVTGFNVSSRTDDINADNSTTSSITTLPLSLSDRGATYTCDVAYASPPKVVTDALATVDIVPAITEDPQSIFVGVGLGRDATFSCSAYGGPTISIPSLEFTWTGPVGIDVSIQETEVVDDIATSTLTLVNVTEDFEGNYTCSVAYSDMPMITSISEIATLRAVRDPPVITEPPFDSVEERGNSTTFSCTAEGNGTLNITWGLPSGEVVFTGQDMEEIWRVNSTLTVIDISATDGGIYSCIAENEAGAVEANASLLVRLYTNESLVLPILTTTNGTVEGLICPIEGFPVEYRWERGMEQNVSDSASGSALGSALGSVLGSGSGSNGGNELVFTRVSIGRVLEFNPVVFGDEGVYRCVATSVEDRTQVSDPTTVTISPEGGVTVTPVGEVYQEGDDVQFTCTSLGGPDNSVQWLKDGENFTDVIDDSSNTLLLMMITVVDDGGVYTCVASNAAGSGSANVSLLISPVFTEDPTDEEIVNGTSVTFSCTALAFPDPTYMWYRMGNELPQSATGANTSMLTLSPAVFGDQGVYHCNATSSGVSVQSEPATLTISPEGGVSITPDNMTFNDTNVVELSCITLGGPANSFQWNFNGEELENETTMILTLPNVTAEDGGAYTCNVTNPAGSETYTTYVFISPVITLDPVDVNATNETNEVNFTCDATGFPEPSFEWIKEGDLDFALSNTSTLTIAPVMFGDEGFYFCRATSNDLVVESERATLSIAPFVQLTPEFAVADVGEDFEFTCNVMGGPMNSFQWEKDSNVLMGEINNTLQLTDVAAAFAGLYQCTVTNAAGSSNGSTLLYVAPNIIAGPENTTANVSMSVTFSCMAEGFPVPDIVWEYEGNSVRNGSSFPGSSSGDDYFGSTSGEMSDSPSNSTSSSQTYVLSDGQTIIVNITVEETAVNSTLTIDSVQYDNFGVYRCVANSSLLDRFTSAAATLSVSPEGSVVITPAGVNATMRGREHTLTCSAEGGPGNAVSWVKLGNEIEISDGPELVIPITDASVGGVYQCTVENLAGSDSATAVVNVIPVFIAEPADMNVTRTEELVLNCSSNGFPRPQIVWLHNGTVVENTSGIMISETFSDEVDITSTLTVMSTSFNNSGNYTCIARSPVFDDVMSRLALVLIQDTPEQPQNLTAIEINSRNITLQWMEPHHNNAPVTGYRVMYTRPDFLILGSGSGGSGDNGMEVLSTPNETVVVTGLHPGVEYIFTVIAVNGIGDSRASEPETATTLEEVPIGSPEIFAAEALSPTEIFVMWMEVPPAERNGVISMYEVRYVPLEICSETVMARTVNITNTSMTFATLTGLEEYVQYNISIRAYTSVGPGPYSDSVVERTDEDVPDMKLNATAIALSETEIAVSWVELSDICQNGNVTVYEIRYEPLETFVVLVTRSENVTAPATMETLTDLEESVAYNISVRAYTSVGPGPYSDQVTATTFEDRPRNAPRNVTTMVLSSTEILVTWKRVLPIDENGEIISYEVEFVPLETFDMAISTNTTNTTSLNITLTDLEEDVEYNISVRAFTSVGPGPYSDPVTNRTLEDSPAAAPQNVITMAESSTEILVTWEEVPAIDENGDITMYEVEYMPLETFNGQIATNSVTVDPTLLNTTLTGLDEYVDYNISVRAFTSVGPGPYSDGMVERTLEDVSAAAPQNVMATAVSSTEIRVSWEQVAPIDQNGIITMYGVRFEPLETFEGVLVTETVNTNGPVLIMNLAGLEEDVDYNISVRAYTSVGPGPYSVGIVERTDQDLPDAPPQNVMTVVLSSTEMQVSWEEVPAINQSGSIIVYEVRYDPLETFNGAISTNTTNTTMLNTTLNNLEENVNYSISVRAYTKIGPGPYSDGVVNRTDEDQPAAAPQNVMTMAESSTEILVTWEEVPAIDENGDITMYEVEYMPLETFNGQIDTDSVTVDPTLLNTTLTGLEEYVDYNISVRAFTSVGPGPYSDPVTNRTLEDRPASPPLNLTVANVTSTTIRVTWDEVPPIERNGIITEYEVEYNQSTFDINTTQTVTVNSTMAELTGLHEYVDYSIRVRAYTRVGAGRYTPDINATTAQDVPSGFPLNITATTLSSSMINVSWETFPRIEHNGILTQYQVQFNQTVTNLTHPPTDTVLVPDTATSVVLTGLGALLNYTISVRALTVIGPGPYNRVFAVAQTDPDVPEPPQKPPEVDEMEDIKLELPPDESLVAVTLRWEIPMVTGGDLTSFNVLLEAIGDVDAGPDSRRRRQTDNFLDDCIVPNTTNNNFTVAPDVTQLDVNATAYSTYAFRVQAVNSVGPGEVSNATIFRTPESVPTMPQNLLVEYNSSTSLVVTWEHPLCDYGSRTSYNFSYVETNSGNDIMEVLDPGTLDVSLSNLEINTFYTVTLCASTSVGCGPATVINNKTDEDAPQAIEGVLMFVNQAQNNDSSVTFTVTWTKPSDRFGPFHYRLEFEAAHLDGYPLGRRRMVNKTTEILTDGNQQSFTFLGALPFASYSITLTPFNIKLSRDGPSSSLSMNTMAIAPTAVTNLVLVAVDSETLRVSWELPQYPNGPLSQYIVYYIEYTGQQPPSFDPTDNYTTITVDYPQRTTRIEGLDPFTNYSVIVLAVGREGGEGLLTPDSVRVNRTYTSTDAPPTLITPTTATGRTTFTIELPDPTDIDTGPVILYAVIIIRITGTFDRDNPPDQDAYNSAVAFDPMANPPQEAYITAAWGNPLNVPTTFTVGDGTFTTVDSVMYENVGLSSDTDYAYIIRFDIMSDTSDEPHIFHTDFEYFKTREDPGPASNAGAIAASVTVILLVLVAVGVAVVLVWIWLRRRAYKFLFEGEIAEGSGQQQGVQMQPVFINPHPVSPYSGTMEPIPLDKFKDHVERMHSNDDYLFSEEYNSIEPHHAPTSIACHLSCNISKNRYANIVAYDHSRVKLSEDPNKEGSDYINANFIDGYKQRNAFIAAQGPNPDTVADFWRMVWEQGSAIIVMLTNLEEKGRTKCHQYWPEDKSGLFGRIRVHLQESLVLTDYTQRCFSLQMNSSKEERIVVQYHYTVWPDHGVPEYPTSLLHFVRKTMSVNPENSGPIVVHCSAGVGRTGTFITLFSQLQRMKEEKNFDIFGYVRGMRYKRNCMVQTEPQYVFIHDALLEAIECGVTEVQARELREQYKQLCEVDVEQKVTSLNLQFDNLDRTIHRKLRRNTGTLQVNKPKNRYGANPDALPYDRNRCRLSAVPGVEGSDYINASFIDGYHKAKAFIATQGPLPDTQDDFWKLVWQLKSATIVMLTKEKEGGKAKCHRYWPQTGAETYGKLQVISCKSTDFTDYVLREFQLVDTKDSSSLNVKQFQYTDWPEESVPASGSGLIDLIGQVQKWQRNSGDKPIIVHCSGGCGRTGTYIVVSILIERLKTEGVVDVFHTVRNLRLQRPGMVHTESQLEFCYQTTLEYLESFELYDNFK